jgi:hypothetical protein
MFRKTMYYAPNATSAGWHLSSTADCNLLAKVGGIALLWRLAPIETG